MFAVIYRNLLSCFSHVRLLCDPAKLLCPQDSLGKNTGVDCRAPLQGIFPNQGSNLRPLRSTCIGRQVLYH